MNDPRKPGELRALLDDLYARYHRAEFLAHDPLGMAHRYEDAADREVVALIGASFAFGNVKAINGTLERILEPLGGHPARTLAEHAPREWGGQYRGFVYRWVRAADLRVYLAWIGSALRAHGSLCALWQSLDNPAGETVLPALQRWVDCLTAQPLEGLRPRKRTATRANGESSALPSGAHLLLTPPSGKSGCKRMNLFLRWVCRPEDGVDLGLWPVAPSRLVMPVDTHILQVSRRLGLTERTANDMRTALEITAALRACCPEDPCRFDFALTRPGILREKALLDAMIGDGRGGIGTRRM